MVLPVTLEQVVALQLRTEIGQVVVHEVASAKVVRPNELVRTVTVRKVARITSFRIFSPFYASREAQRTMLTRPVKR